MELAEIQPGWKASVPPWWKHSAVVIPSADTELETAAPIKRTRRLRVLVVAVAVLLCLIGILLLSFVHLSTEGVSFG